MRPCWYTSHLLLSVRWLVLSTGEIVNSKAKGRHRTLYLQYRRHSNSMDTAVVTEG